MENIRYIKLKNKGGFVAKITVQYKGKHTVYAQEILKRITEV